ncbi:hypothetical protein E2C01_101217 [Portunus trituberculatus]|uniref:Uncharacterized protein n=1 Tax=Portunus trituberculatus TaxID=210409 RepID=A0A5B7K903_PORTR|nr:hypothetical protein [Portunus trituberculatus]
MKYYRVFPGARHSFPNPPRPCRGVRDNSLEGLMLLYDEGREVAQDPPLASRHPSALPLSNSRPVEVATMESSALICSQGEDRLQGPCGVPE